MFYNVMIFLFQTKVHLNFIFIKYDLQKITVSTLIIMLHEQISTGMISKGSCCFAIKE